MLSLLITINALILTASAVGFAGWQNGNCKGPWTQQLSGLASHECIAVGSSAGLRSIRGSGLSNSNIAHGHRLILYKDAGCEEYSSTVKHSGYCLQLPYRSLRYVPEEECAAEEEAELARKQFERENDPVAVRENRELDEALLRLEQEFEAEEALWQVHKAHGLGSAHREL